MAVLMNPTVNYKDAWKELKERLPELRKYSSFDNIIEASIDDMMKELEKKHKNMITIKSLRDSEMVDDCIKKTVEARMENIYLKEKLRKQKTKTTNPARFEQLINEMINEIYRSGTYRYTKENIPHKHIAFSDCDIYMIDRLEEMKIMLPQFQEMIPKDMKKDKPKRKLFKVHLITITNDSLEFNLDMKVTAKKFEYYKNAYNKGEDISWHGLRMRIAQLNYRYPEGDKKEGMTFRYLRREE